jgi:hypothetical protein
MRIKAGDIALCPIVAVMTRTGLVIGRNFGCAVNLMTTSPTSLTARATAA